MAEAEAKEKDPKHQDNKMLTDKNDRHKAELMEFINDVEELINENELVREDHGNIWPRFDSEIPQSVKKVRPKRKKPSTVDSGIPEQEKGDLY